MNQESDVASDTENPAEWQRSGNCIYVLEHAGWKKGVEQFRNRFSISVHNDSGSLTPDEIESLARKVHALPDLIDALKYARRFLKRENHDTDYIDGILARVMP